MIRKLATIIVVSFVTVNGLFLAGVSLMSYHVFFNFTSDEISEARLALLNESVNKVSNFITSVGDAGLYVATNRALVRTFSEEVVDNYDAILEQRELSDLIDGITSVKRSIHSIKIYTDRYNGYTSIRDGAVLPMEMIEREPWFRLMESMDNGWISKHASPLDNRDYISYLHRLINQWGKTVGYVQVNVQADTFFKNISDDDLFSDPKTPLILLDAGGRMIAQTHERASLSVLEQITLPGRPDSYGKLRDDYDRLSNYHQIVKSGDESYLLLISKPNYERWRLVLLIPLDALYAKTKELGWFVLLLGVCGLLLSVPLAYWVGKRIVVPIRNLIQGLRQVEKGRFDTRIGPHFIEEYDALARTFNHMTSQLDESLHNLKLEHRARRDADLRLLQSQIMPHFLYNTLDIIHWKAMDHQAEDISVMVNQLSRMFRIGLSGGQTFIKLQDELEHAKCFIQIQRLRLKQEILYEVKIPAVLKEYYVPKIVLQPFIENSMRHGYAEGFDGAIRVRLSASRKEGPQHEWLEITIADEGGGLPAGWSMADAKGIGIRNVQERIWMHCGAEYGIELSNREEGGTQVRIRLPVIRNAEELHAWQEKEMD